MISVSRDAQSSERSARPWFTRAPLRRLRVAANQVSFSNSSSGPIDGVLNDALRIDADEARADQTGDLFLAGEGNWNSRAFIGVDAEEVGHLRRQRQALGNRFHQGRLVGRQEN